MTPNLYPLDVRSAALDTARRNFGPSKEFIRLAGLR